MPVSPDAEQNLTDLIYGAMLGENSWQVFLERFNDQMGHGKTTLLFHDATSGIGTLSLSCGYSPEETHSYHAYYNTVNPWMAKASVRPVGLGVTSDAMYDPGRLTGTEFYNDFLAKLDLRGGAGLTVQREGGRSFILTSLMSAADHRDSEDYARLLTQLCPHLRRAFSFYRNNAGIEEKNDVMLLDEVGVGLIIAGENAQMRRLNRTAERMMAEQCGFRITPTGRVAVNDAEIQSALAKLGDRRSAPRFYTKRLQTGRQALDVTVVKLASDAIYEFIAGPSVAILLKKAGCLPEQSLERLTPRERQIALAIAQGKRVEEIASENGVSRETVRAQLKSVFAKLGVSSQLALAKKFS